MRVIGEAHDAAMHVLNASGCTVNGAILIAELDGRGLTLAVDAEANVDQVSTMLAEASWRAAGAVGDWTPPR